MRRILLDMDELLSDFVGGACNLYGLTPAEVYPHWPLGQWSMEGPLSAATGTEVTVDSFWRRIDEEPGFWHFLDPLPWFQLLTDAVDMFSRRNSLEPWHVITSPGRDPSCYLGKAVWLKRQFGRNFDRFAITPHKELFAQPGVVLIDDRESNVEAFTRAGGTGILFPAHHNRRHPFKSAPVDFVRKELEALCT